MMPTAMATPLPRMANSLNFLYSRPCLYLSVYTNELEVLRNYSRFAENRYMSVITALGDHEL